MKLIISLFLTLGLFINLQAQSLQTENAKISQIQSLINQLDAEIIDDHCEVPCGIYGDSLRIALMYEHAFTIEKGIMSVNELAEADTPNYNQIVRWVMNKEHHAEQIQDIVSQYFLHQRIKKPKDRVSKDMLDQYHHRLATLHAIAVGAMKCKQASDLDRVKALKDAIHDFEHAYFGEQGHKH